MKALARAVTYTLFAVIIAMSLSVTWTTGLFWWVMFACAAAGIGILAGQWVNASRELDAFLASEDEADDTEYPWPMRLTDDGFEPEDDRLARDVARYHCAAHGCRLEVVSHDRRGTRWSCVNCGATSWVPCASVFDQDGVA